jgi:uncharacterized protein (UPF0248 family)
MQPLHELLHRIRWDAEFGRGEFALGYYDRVLDEELVIPFSSVRLDTSGRPALAFTDPGGVTQRLPLHRVRTVYKNGQVIWKRPPR